MDGLSSRSAQSSYTYLSNQSRNDKDLIEKLPNDIQNYMHELESRIDLENEDFLAKVKDYLK